VVSKEKKPLKNKSLADWQEEEKFQHSFEEAIRDIQTLIKANFTKNFGVDLPN